MTEPIERNLETSGEAEEFKAPTKTDEKPKDKGGRRSGNWMRILTRESLNEAAPHAAEFLKKIAKGGNKRPKRERVLACQYIINQVIGSPRQSLEHTGEGGGPIKITTVEVVRPYEPQPQEPQEDKPETAP